MPKPKKNDLSSAQRKELLATLKSRFEKNMSRYPWYGMAQQIQLLDCSLLPHGSQVRRRLAKRGREHD